MHYQGKLYALDVKTGNIVRQPAYPQLADTLDNIGFLRMDQDSDSLFALHWDRAITVDLAENLRSPDFKLRVFPNPSKGIWQLELSPFLTDAAYQVFDLKGRLITSGKINSKGFQPIDLSAQPSGNYYIRVWAAGQIHSQQLIKVD